MAENKLYYGDNLDVLRRHIPDASVDLVYLDPPFNSNQDYNILFGHKEGQPAPAQIRAFEDTWEWNEASALAYAETVELGGEVSRTLQAFRTILEESDMLAYLSMMAPRLVALRRAMKPTASIYLHCDPTASHYLKLLMDAVFGPASFRNEIIWKRTSGHSDATRYGRVHDAILYYVAGPDPTWNETYQPYEAEYVEQYYRYEDEDGRRFMSGDLSAAGLQGGGYEYEWKGVTRIWRVPEARMVALDAEGRVYYTRNGFPRIKRYLDEMPGLPAQDVWADIQALRSWHGERLGYPTQKPEALLDRIIEASSNPEDVVLDPFCGCGTAVASAQKLGRRWIGIDITHLAINLIRHRLQDSFGPEIAMSYDVVGEPVSVPDAEQLAKDDPYQFQFWALGLVGARPHEEKKGADRGIDGRLYFHDEGAKGKTKQVIISVKAGKTGPAHVRDLRGVVDREGAAIGVLVSFQEPTDPMRKEAASADFYESPWGKHARIQLLTVAELLQGKRIDMPDVRGANVTYKRAPEAARKVAEPQLELEEEP
ncbi:MAG: DNA methyltransferase [Gemmatimonadota bacterium]